MSAEGRGNVDPAVVESFGHEWLTFDQSALSAAERASLFDGYFAIFPWEKLPDHSIGFDAGCGTGRWAVLAAPRVGHLHCIDPSSAIEAAARNLRDVRNCSLHRASVDDMPLADESMDFGYSLGVLHHLPDTGQGLASCVRKLRKGAPFLVYLYYAFDNQPLWFRLLWRLSDGVRRIVSQLPPRAKVTLTTIMAWTVYWPLARIARVLEWSGVGVHSFPLSQYRTRSLYTMRTDALDRFGTGLERRFTKAQIKTLMEGAGLERIQFSPNAPFWCAVGYRK